VEGKIKEKPEHPRNQQGATGVAILIVSDTRSEASDESGKLAKQLLTQKGHHVLAHLIVKNERAAIQSALLTFLRDPRIQVIITSGGTGISSRDVTVDAVSELFEKTIVGFGEFFRRISFEEIGDSAMISRATAGIIDGRAIFCLPGSKNAMKSGLTHLILPGLGHLLWEANR
jgi:molybdenum cofactor biosynthesis protein B